MYTLRFAAIPDGVGWAREGHWRGIGPYFWWALGGHWRGIGGALAPTFGGHWVGIGGHWRALAGIGTHKRTYLRSCPRLGHACKKASFHMQKCIVGPAVSAERRNRKRLQKSQKFPRTETFILLNMKKRTGKIDAMVSSDVFAVASDVSCCVLVGSRIL